MIKSILIFFSLTVFIVFDCKSQLQINKQVQLTGTGNDARITGIDSVAAGMDAVSVSSLQSGKFISGITTGSSNNFLLNINPPITSYTFGLMINFMANFTTIGPATLNINNLGAVPIKKNINVDLSGCDIGNGQMVTVIYDGTNFQLMSNPYASGIPTAYAGPDQLNIPDSSATLAASAPSFGTGAWSIISGIGGTVISASNPNSVFSGAVGNSYILAWTVTYACYTISDSVAISFLPYGKRFFVTSTTYTGSMGGLSGADAACQSRANAANLGGTWKAFLSGNATADWVGSRLAQFNGPYTLVNGTQVATNWANLMSGTLNVSPNLDEFGNVSGATQIWCNTLPGGNAINANSGLFDCNDWTNAGSGSNDFSGAGKPSEYTTSGYWTWGDPPSCSSSSWAGRCYDYCNVALPIYCIEQ